MTKWVKYLRFITNGFLIYNHFLEVSKKKTNNQIEYYVKNLKR